MSASHPLTADEPNSQAGGETNTSARQDHSGSMSILAEQTIAAPESLGLETRLEFREAASSLIDRVSAGTGRLVVDCADLKSIDSSGLNALILVHRKAAQRRIKVVLRDLNGELLALLVLTKLDDLFELQHGQAR